LAALLVVTRAVPGVSFNRQISLRVPFFSSCNVRCLSGSIVIGQHLQMSAFVDCRGPIVVFLDFLTLRTECRACENKVERAIFRVRAFFAPFF